MFILATTTTTSLLCTNLRPAAAAGVQDELCAFEELSLGLGEVGDRGVNEDSAVLLVPASATRSLVRSERGLGC